MAKRCFARFLDDPPIEYVIPSGYLQRWFACAWCVVCLVFAPVTSFPVHVIVASAALTTAGIAISTINVNKYPLFAEAANIFWFASASVLGHFIVFGIPSYITRQRSAASAIMITKQVPAWFGFRSITCVMYLMWSLLLDWANGYLMNLYYGDVYTITMASNAFIWTCLYAFSASAHLAWIRLVYSMGSDLKSEKTAMERLLSLVCDCQVCVHANGDTMLRSTPLFDSFTGCAMEATQLSDATIFSAEDAERLQYAFERGIKGPVILPISICNKSGEIKDVDFLIVKRAHETISARKDQQSSCCCEANGNNDIASFSFLIGVRLNDAGQFGPSCDKDGAFESGSFDDDNFAEVLNVDEDHSDGRSGGNSTTVTGRVFEGLNSALVDGDRDSVKRCLERITRIGRAEKWIVPLSHICLLPTNVLGRGGFGIVICGTIFGTDVAVKLVKTKDSDLKRQLQSLPNELRILRGIHHPNVVQFFGGCIDVGNFEIGLIFERVHGICMSRFVRGSPKTPEDAGNRYALMCDISGALRFLHSQKPPIVHSDLKPANVMVESICWEDTIRPKAKILDFGLARFATRGAKAAGGTLQWIAPEIIRDPTIVLKPSVDVYSFGHIFFFLNTGKQPLEGVSREEILYRTRLEVQEELLWPAGVQPYAEGSKELVARCVSIDTDLRPSMELVHVDVLSWKTCHTTGASPLHQEATWIKGLEILRAQKKLKDSTKKILHL